MKSGSAFKAQLYFQVGQTEEPPEGPERAIRGRREMPERWGVGLGMGAVAPDPY